MNSKLFDLIITIIIIIVIIININIKNMFKCFTHAHLHGSMSRVGNYKGHYNDKNKFMI